MRQRDLLKVRVALVSVMLAMIGMLPGSAHADAPNSCSGDTAHQQYTCTFTFTGNPVHLRASFVLAAFRLVAFPSGGVTAYPLPVDIRWELSAGYSDSNDVTRTGWGLGVVVQVVDFDGNIDRPLGTELRCTDRIWSDSVNSLIGWSEFSCSSSR